MKYHKILILFLSILATFIFYWHLPELVDLVFEMQDYPRGTESIGIDYHSLRVRRAGMPVAVYYYHDKGNRSPPPISKAEKPHFYRKSRAFRFS